MVVTDTSIIRTSHTTSTTKTITSWSRIQAFTITEPIIVKTILATSTHTIYKDQVIIPTKTVVVYREEVIDVTTTYPKPVDTLGDVTLSKGEFTTVLPKVVPVYETLTLSTTFYNESFPYNITTVTVNVTETVLNTRSKVLPMVTSTRVLMEKKPQEKQGECLHKCYAANLGREKYFLARVNYGELRILIRSLCDHLLTGHGNAQKSLLV